MEQEHQKMKRERAKTHNRVREHVNKKGQGPIVVSLYTAKRPHARPEQRSDLVPDDQRILQQLLLVVAYKPVRK